jgi:hypothetical protein
VGGSDRAVAFPENGGDFLVGQFLLEQIEEFLFVSIQMRSRATNPVVLIRDSGKVFERWSGVFNLGNDGQIE